MPRLERWPVPTAFEHALAATLGRSNSAWCGDHRWAMGISAFLGITLWVVWVVGKWPHLEMIKMMIYRT